MKTLITLSALFLLLSACGESKKSEDGEYSYSYQVSNCPTGVQTFSTERELCEGLTDDSLNRNCAGRKRCREFNQRCLKFDLGITCNPRRSQSPSRPRRR